LPGTPPCRPAGTAITLLGDPGMDAFALHPRPLPRRHPLSAVPALPAPHDPAAPGGSGVDHPEVLAAAVTALQAALAFRGLPRLADRSISHGYLLRRSSCVYFFRCRTGAASPAGLMPTMLAAAAQPTRQSNQSRLRQGYAGQGLSGRVGHGVHSRTTPPGPMTSTHFSERATCSAINSWWRPSLPNRLMQPRSPAAVEKPSCTNRFQ